MTLHHIGIATPDAAALSQLYGSLLDIPVVHEERVDGIDIVFLELPHGYLELLEPVDAPDLSRFLDRNGPGLHHLAFETDNLARTLATAESMGITLIDETPRPGAWGHEIAFVHPKDTGGVLVEFVSA